MQYDSIIIDEIVKRIMGWVETTFTLQNPEVNLPKTWESFWAVIQVWLNSKSSLNGLPLDPILIKSARDLLTYQVEQTRLSHMEMIRRVSERGRIYQTLKYKIAVWYHVNTGRGVPGYKHRKRITEDLIDLPAQLSPLQPHLLHGMIIKSPPRNDDSTMPYGCVV